MPCERKTTKHYTNRDSPPFGANESGCRGTSKLGNDGKLWHSVVNSAGVYTWRRSASPKKQSPKKLQRKKSPKKKSPKKKSPKKSRRTSPDRSPAMRKAVAAATLACRRAEKKGTKSLDCGSIRYGAIDGYGSAAGKKKKSYLTLAAVRSIERAHRTGQY